MVVLELTSVVRMPPLGHCDVRCEDAVQIQRNWFCILTLKSVSPQILREVINHGQNPDITFAVGHVVFGQIEHNELPTTRGQNWFHGLLLDGLVSRTNWAVVSADSLVFFAEVCNQVVMSDPWLGNIVAVVVLLVISSHNLKSFPLSWHTTEFVKLVAHNAGDIQALLPCLAHVITTHMIEVLFSGILRRS